MGNIRILIADGSPVYKKLFMEASAEAAEKVEMIYVSTAGMVCEAIRNSVFDIVVIDVELTKPDSIEFISGIKEVLPQVIILLTAAPSPRNGIIFAKAVDNGVYSCLIKPIESSYKDNYLMIRRTMKNMVNWLRQSNLSEGLSSDLRLNQEVAKVVSEVSKVMPDAVSMPSDGTEVMQEAVGSSCRPEIVLIASSTGGPSALRRILSSLKADFPVPILVVQHMPDYFSETMAANLRHKTALKVKVAENGDDLTAGTIYIAPGQWHMKMDGDKKIVLDDTQLVNGVRPSADVLFTSIADNPCWSCVMAVILTGMGSDGKGGVERLKASTNCICLAQSEETSAIYGMPRAVIEGGLADKILDLDIIAETIEGFFI
ncbi:MAG: hypothetical protein LBV33_03445 [Lachnospiraceae bacterium]|jgi:two-component system chemotaxis response regulator CheB|nr:hypothetical protein [Lachnospiraceae bacterium]